MERCRHGEAAADGEVSGKKKVIASDVSRPGREEGRVWGCSACHLEMSYFDGAAGGKVIAEGRKD